MANARASMVIVLMFIVLIALTALGVHFGIPGFRDSL